MARTVVALSDSEHLEADDAANTVARQSTLSVVKQSNELARSRFRIDPGLQATRVMLLGMSKVAREMDLLNSVVLRKTEIAQVWPEIYKHKGWKSKLLVDVKNLLTLQHEIVRPDGTISVINALKQADILPNGDIMLVFHEDTHSHIGMSIRNNFTKFRLGEVRSLKRTEHIKLFTLLKSYAFVGTLKISAEALKRVCGIEEGYTEHRYLKHFFVEPAVKKINAESSIRVAYDYHGGKGRPPSFTFKIQEKDHVGNESPLEQAAAALLQAFGVDDDISRRLVEEHGVEHCLQWLYYARHQKAESKIKTNPGGYLRELIVSNGALPELGKIRKLETIAQLQAALLRKTFAYISESEQLRLVNEFSADLGPDDARLFTFAVSQSKGWPQLRTELDTRFLNFLRIQMDAIIQAVPFLAGSRLLERKVRQEHR